MLYSQMVLLVLKDLLDMVFFSGEQVLGWIEAQVGGVRFGYRLHCPGTGGLVVGRRGVDQALLGKATDRG